MGIKKQNYLAVAVDFDGTLLNSNHQISSNNSRVLQRLHQQGIEIILASGRMKASMVDIWKKLGFSCWVISYNGAQILRTETPDWKLLYSVNVSTETYDAVIDLCQNRSLFLNIYTNNGLYAFQANKNWQFADLYSSQTGAIYLDKFSQINDLPKSGIIKLLAITQADERQPLIDDISKEFSAHCQIIKSNPEYTEFHNSTVNKGNALKKWSELSGIHYSKVVALGDAENDFEMLTTAGLGLAPKNSTAGLLESFDNISKYTNDEDFVSRELTSLFSLDPE